MGSWALTGVGWLGYYEGGCGCLGRSGGTVDAAVSKTVGSYIPCEFDSHLRHHVLGAMGAARLDAAGVGGGCLSERAGNRRLVIFEALVCAECECE